MRPRSGWAPGTRKEVTTYCVVTAFSVWEDVGWCLPVTRWWWRQWAISKEIKDQEKGVVHRAGTKSVSCKGRAPSPAFLTVVAKGCLLVVIETMPALSATVFWRRVI